MLKHTVVHDPVLIFSDCEWLKSCSVLNRATIEEAEGDVCELESKLDKVRCVVKGKREMAKYFLE